MGAVLYERHGRPVCFEKALFEPDFLGRFVQELFSSRLTWYWESERSEPVDVAAAHDLPASRPLTLLNNSTTSEFQNDWQERAVDGNGRFIAIFGVETAPAGLHADATWVRTALNDFALCERGPIAIVIVQICDMSWQNVFVPHEVAKPVQDLLLSWGLDAAAVARVRPYSALRLARLEEMFSIP